MPTRDLLALADRWRQDPTRAAQDGELLAASRAALASLDGRERAVLGEQLRSQGAGLLADRLEASDRLPVWSDEFTGVARDLLTLDSSTVDGLLEAIDPDAVSDLAPPVGAPVDLPPPSSPDPPLPAPPDAEVVVAEEADTRPPDAALETPPPAPVSPAWEARRWQPWDPSAARSRGPAPVATDAAGGAVARTDRGEAAPSLAPGVRSSLVARTRFVQLDERIAAGLTPAAAQELIAEAPDGWQRRRVILRLLDAGVRDLDVDEVLSGLARDADRTTVADRLVRHGDATLAQVLGHLPAGAAHRLARRHG